MAGLHYLHLHDEVLRFRRGIRAAVAADILHLASIILVCIAAPRHPDPKQRHHDKEDHEDEEIPSRREVGDGAARRLRQAHILYVQGAHRLLRCIIEVKLGSMR